MITANTHLMLGATYSSKPFALPFHPHNNPVSVVNLVCEFIALFTVSDVSYSNSAYLYILMLTKSYKRTLLIMLHQPIIPNI